MSTYKFVDDAEPESHSYDFDLIVIGGGSGGLACAKEAANFGKKVALLDFVQPSPAGTSWGLGGTCVNVGCIPKKLMHQASLLGECISDSEEFGWTTGGKKHDWGKMVQSIQDHIGSLNFGYRVALRNKNVQYINNYGVFVDPHTIECISRAGAKTQKTARRFLIATGGRPKYPEMEGIEHCISSDDFFSLPSSPGKLLVIGASYVALECGGFAAGVGCDTTIMVRSILLRGFDQQIAEKIGDFMSNNVKFIRPAVPKKVEKLATGKLKVTWLHDTTGEASDEFDTVLVAVGREAETKKIGLDKAGVKVDPHSGKLRTENERTNVPHIYAIGDILHGKPELTPVAIKAGVLLARRLYDSSSQSMDYVNVPTTVFTPLEYGCCGLSEEDAITKYGEQDIEVYHTNFTPLEWTVPHRETNACYCKLVCVPSQNQKVVGFHILGPHAGEVTQGFAVAIKAGATKHTFDETVGIHPTVAEEFTTLSVTKSSGISAEKAGC